MQITDFKQLNRGDLKAAFTVVIPQWDLTIKDMKYFEKSDGSSWIAYPSRTYQDNEGKTKYVYLVVFGERAKPKFESAVREALRPFLAPATQTQMQFHMDDDGCPF